MLRMYSLDMPYLDQWEFAVLLGKSYEGHLDFQDFWKLHNEHRVLFPRIFLLLLARLSHWNLLWELAANLLLGVVIFGVFLYIWRRAAGRCGYGGFTPVDSWVAVLMSLLSFSMSQWQNWFVGWQAAEFIQLLAVLFGLILLDTDHPVAGRIAGAAVLGFVATFSFASGLVFWPVG